MESAVNPSRRGVPLLLTTKPGPWICGRGLPPPYPRPCRCLAILRFGAASTGPREDNDRNVREARVRPRRRRRRPSQDQQELSASPVPWTTIGTPCSKPTSSTSSTARSFAPTIMIPHRRRRSISWRSRFCMQFSPHPDLWSLRWTFRMGLRIFGFWC